MVKPVACVKKGDYAGEATTWSSGMIVIERGTDGWDKALAALTDEGRHQIWEDQVLFAQAFIGWTADGVAVRLDPETVLRKPCGALEWARGQ
jgi:hypothetical protein